VATVFRWYRELKAPISRKFLETVIEENARTSNYSMSETCWVWQKTAFVGHFTKTNAVSYGTVWTFITVHVKEIMHIQFVNKYPEYFFYVSK